MRIKLIIRMLSSAALVASAATATHANQLIVNGGFETGDYTGWSTNVQDGSTGGLFVVPNDGGLAPTSTLNYAVNPTGGNYFSISDQTGPGSYSLIQSFTLATAGTIRVSFDMFTNNYADANFPNGRDYTVIPNQNAVVDLLAGGADPFTDNATDIVATFFGPGGDVLGSNPPPSPSPWASYKFSLSLAAGTYQIRFAETDNQLWFNQGVDNVSVSNAPEPASWAMMLGGFGLIGGAMRRRRTTTGFA